ncbi:MAG: putative Ig domain-containing protein [Methanolobus sp.]|nr:putative Ig domain-containing protein [Methanolobus sp.]
MDGVYFETIVSNDEGTLVWDYDKDWDSEKSFTFKIDLDRDSLLSGDTTTFTPSATSLTTDIGDSTTFSISSGQPFTSLDWYLDGELVESGAMSYTQEWTTSGTHSISFEGDTGLDVITETWSVVVSEVGSSTISISPSSTVVAPGETFSLDVYIDPKVPLSGSQFDMQYSSLASVSSVQEGGLFSSGGLSTTFYGGDVDELASVLGSVYSAIMGFGTISTAGSMATVNMVAGTSTGILELALSDVVLSDADSDPAPYDVVNATVLVDSAPEFEPVSAESVTEGDTIMFMVSATDPDGDPLTYSCTSLPDGATFNPATRLFTWNTLEGDAGDYNAVFGVTDGYLKDSISVGMTVAPLNHAPVISTFEPADTAVFEEGGTVTISVGAVDADDDSLSYTIAIDGSQVSNSTTYEWYIGYTSAGSHIIEVTVSDGMNTVTSSHTVSVTDLHPRWDINEDGIVNVLDVTFVGQNYGKVYSDSLPRWDINQDGNVNIQDLSIVAARFGQSVE